MNVVTMNTVNNDTGFKNWLRIMGASGLMICIALAFSLFGAGFPSLVFALDDHAIDTGNNTWIMVSSALVMLMTPGLAFFYAGMVSRRNVVSTLLQNYVSLAVVGILWVAVGYSLVFTDGNGFIGGFDSLFLKDLYGQTSSDGVPQLTFVAFQMMFACIAVALISGSIAERVNFGPWILLMALWLITVYVPVAHWVWGNNGWIGEMGAIDFAGGLVVHITAGVAGLLSALLYGQRFVVQRAARPNDVSLIMLGAALLWFGWFGFNAGSALNAGQLASHAFIVTFVGASSGFIGWMSCDWISKGKPTAVGSAMGMVAGLVTITPAAGFVSIESSIALCFFSAVLCNIVAVVLKNRTRLDDSLDVFACHGVGGIIGAVGTGLLATRAVNPDLGIEGLLISGETELFVANVLSTVVVIFYTAGVTFLLVKIISIFAPIRVSTSDEKVGLDESVHGEIARYNDQSV